MDALPLFPLNTVLFPAMPLRLHIFEERYKQMIARCLAEDMHFGVVLIRQGSEVGAPAWPFEIGTTAQIISVERLFEGRMNLVAVGRRRFRVLDVQQNLPYLTGRVEYVPHLVGERASIGQAADAVRRLFMDYLKLMASLVDAELNLEELPAEAASLAYAVATAMQVENDVKQAWLAADSVQQILESEAQLLPKEIARMRMFAAIEQERKKGDQRIGPFSTN